jgi:hypothetical protein
MLLVLFLTDVRAEPAASPSHVLGGELGYFLQPFGFDDPYSWSLGGRLFYELHGLFDPVAFFFGARASIYGYYPLEDDFTESFMLMGGVYAGYDLSVKVDEKFALIIAPYLGYSHYFREFIFAGKPYQANRPVIVLGANVDLAINRHFLLGLSVEFELLAENEPLLVLGQFERVGVRF